MISIFYRHVVWLIIISVIFSDVIIFFSSGRYANLFLHPVTDEIAPEYTSTVHRPMDLSTIKKNIESGTIRSTDSFQRDIMLMFQNAIMYNRSDHDVYRMACDMQTDVLKIIEVSRGWQGCRFMSWAKMYRILQRWACGKLTQSMGKFGRNKIKYVQRG